MNKISALRMSRVPRNRFPVRNMLVDSTAAPLASNQIRRMLLHRARGFVLSVAQNAAVCISLVFYCCAPIAKRTLAMLEF